MYCNPEVAGGKGFSGATGIAGFPNGESSHVSDPSPNFSIARLFVRQRIDLNEKTIETLTDEVNQV
jgi:high affinity Mn2+ porin